MGSERFEASERKDQRSLSKFLIYHRSYFCNMSCNRFLSSICASSSEQSLLD